MASHSKVKNLPQNKPKITTADLLILKPQTVHFSIYKFMSDSDDWEKFAEKDDDEGLDKILKSGKFGDEQVKVEENKVVPQATTAKEEKKTKAKDKGKKKTQAKPEPEKPKSEMIAEGKRKAEIADNEITEDLFNVKPVMELSSEDDYIEYAREINRRLFKGQYHFRLPNFFAEIFKETSKLMKVEEINKVISQISVIHSERVKAEKPVKKANNKPGLKADAKKLQVDEEDADEYNEYEDFL